MLSRSTVITGEGLSKSEPRAMREPVTTTVSTDESAACIHVVGIRQAAVNSAYRFRRVRVRNLILSMTTSRERAQTLALDIVKKQARAPHLSQCIQCFDACTQRPSRPPCA